LAANRGMTGLKSPAGQPYVGGQLAKQLKYSLTGGAHENCDD